MLQIVKNAVVNTYCKHEICEEFHHFSQASKRVDRSQLNAEQKDQSKQKCQ